MDKDLYARAQRDDEGNIVKLQTLNEHSVNTAELAGDFAAPFGMEKEARAAGALHDAGKSSPKFQNRLINEGPKCDHSTAGGVIAAGKLNRPDLAMCIMGHHAGLPDLGGRCDCAGTPTLRGRLKKENIPDYSDWKKLELQQYLENIPAPDPGLSAVDHYLRTRLLFSSLVDADFIDTESFFSPDIKRGVDTSIEELAYILEKHIAENKLDEQTEGINGIRSEISLSAKEAASGDKGIYSLTVPTGSGKTLSSLRFALNHAKKHGLKRVIYVIPYVNIIEQTADTFREILGERNVLEHHADMTFDDKSEENSDSSQSLLKLATENWDAPVIVTTAVQFFESLFSNKTSKSRKIHNIADAVIIYDEVQMLPVNNWIPLISIMEAINKNTGATQLLCTATQPAIEFPNETEIKEIAKNSAEYQKRLKRVTFKNSGVLQKEEIVEKMLEHNQALVIVNTKKTAKELFDLLPEDGGNYHLTTNMVPAHRRRVLSEIRQKLKDGKPVRLVATSLVEAGVDLDFEYVMRELAGIDSVLQAAGRCNRNGKRTPEESITEVFELDKRPHKGIEQQTQAAKSALGELGEDSINADYTHVIEYYFNLWRDFKGKENLDLQNIMKKMKLWEHGKIGQRFKMIDSPTDTVYIPYDDTSVKLIERLNNGEINRDIMRKLSPYSVQVYKNQLNDLMESGFLYTIKKNNESLIYILNYNPKDKNQNVYDGKTGLALTAESGNAVFI